jgi:hypothetical protein
VTGRKMGRIRLGRELALQFAQRFPLVITEHNAPPMRVKINHATQRLSYHDTS